MATNAQPKTSEEETITCSICQNILENPRRLDCLHSFCDRCLKNVDRISEKGTKGILCPLCRKFTSEPQIKKDPILEVLVEAFSQYYDKNILNKDSMDKFCNQCDTRINVTSYCADCKVELCQTCQTRHLRFEAMTEHSIIPIAEAGNHPVVNVTKYCPKHVTKPIKLSCVPCKLAICVDCKIEDHDTHKTEDVTSALASVLPELRASIPLLNAEKNKQDEVKEGLNSFVKDATSLGKEILDNAEKVRDDLVSHIQKEFNKIEETVVNFVQSVTKEANLRENDANNSISSIDSMTSWISVLADVTEGPAVLFEVCNEKLLDRVKGLLTECQKSRDLRVLHDMGSRKPRFRQTPIQCDNILGNIQFEEDTKHKTDQKPIIYKVPTKSMTSEVKSFRYIDRKLCGFKVKKHRGSFKLNTHCDRFCYHQESLWCPHDDTIDIYSLDGQLQMSQQCPPMRSIIALHPLTPTCMLVSAECGLYTYNTTHHTVSNTLREGVFWDVHASGTYTVALQKRPDPGDLIHVFTNEDPPTHSLSFCVNHTDVLRVMVHNQCVYVSACNHNTSVSVYTVKGQMISQYGSFGHGKSGQMDYPILCAVGCDESLLIADCDNKRLQLMNKKGKFSVVKGVDVKWNWDVVIVGSNLFLLCGYFSDSKIHRYEL